MYVKEVDIFNESTTLSSLLEAYYVTDGKSKMNFQTLTEDDKAVLGKATVTKLFNTVKTKALKVNYAGIEKSKGDITKFNKYDDLQNSIKILNNMYNADPSNSPTEIPKLVRCLQILKKYKAKFMTSFNNKNEVVIMLYTNIVAALIGCTSLMISTTIEYIKTPTGDYKAIFKGKKAKTKNVYYNSIDRFLKMEVRGQLNSLFKDNEVKTSLNESADGVVSEDVLEAGAAAFSALMAVPIGQVAVVIVGIFVAVLIAREVVYLYFYSRTKISEELLTLAYFLEEHSQSLDENSKTKEKQEKVVAKLKRLSEILSVDKENAGKKAEQEQKKEDEENRNSNDTGSSSSDDNDILL